MKPILGIDVDNTIWNPGPWVCEAALEITGQTLDPESVTVLTHLFDLYGERAALEISDRVFSPKRVPERKPYPGSTEVLRSLQEDRGVRIHFITHNDPDPMTPHLDPWLREHFGPEVGLTITRGDKVEILREVRAFGLIDDHPETIERAADAGIWAAAMCQPWNRKMLAERDDVYGFSDWREVPTILPRLC